jgi:predicted HicB family RNase H-like nuclease
LNPAYSARNRVGPMTSVETLLDLSLPQDIRRRASACADSQGITLNEFINRAIAEKLYPADQKNLTN